MQKAELHNPIDDLMQLSEDVSVVTDPVVRDVYSTDIQGKDDRPLAVVKPGSVEALQAVVRLCEKNRIAIAPRGGGMSYSGGYAVAGSAAIVLDTSGLDRIVDINLTNGTVTVESGVTWARLWHELKKHGVRTPFYGPFSGGTATVGGALSQHAASLGSSAFGISADNVLNLDVVIGDGSMVSTGSMGAENGHNFYRYFGPDLTGLFLGDCGALGIKARVTMRLIPVHRYRSSASFNFETFEDIAQAMSAVARLGVAECSFGNDPAALAQMTRSQESSPEAARAVAKAVFNDAPNPVIGAWRVLRLAVAGERFLKKLRYNFHIIVEGHSMGEVRRKLQMAKQAAREYGEVVPNTLPTVISVNPFLPIPPPNPTELERGYPQHCVLPFDKVIDVHNALQALYQRYEPAMEKHGISPKCMFATLSTHAMLYETIVNWRDSPSDFQRHHFAEELASVDHARLDNPEGRAIAAEIMRETRQLFAEHGAINFQLGKSYPYFTRLKPGNQSILQTLKNELDPHGILNPEALNLTTQQVK
jgi:D-lactate dehydrogenase (cytochrome)